MTETKWQVFAPTGHMCGLTFPFQDACLDRISALLDRNIDETRGMSPMVARAQLAELEQELNEAASGLLGTGA
jgi:hypothetical protein